jgi:orotidine-5'-phosphate decarboxylase
MGTFVDRLCAEIVKKKSFLVAGLDPQLRYMPPHLVENAVVRFGMTFEAVGELFFQFNKFIIDAVRDVVVAFKPQRAFYEAYGSYGDKAYNRTVAFARSQGLLVIGDCKRNDGGDTAEAYADGHIGQVPFFGARDSLMALTRRGSPMRVDCLTVTPYIGEACIGPFIKRVKEFGTGIFVVTKTSFKPNSAVEQLESPSPFSAYDSVWQKVARMVEEWGGGTEGACGLRNVGVVCGATYPDDARIMRRILPNSFFLKPGYGGQGASAQDSVIGILENGFGIVVNDSRNLAFAWQNKKGKYQCEPEKFADAARLQAVDDRDALVAAAKESGNWPF